MEVALLPLSPNLGDSRLAMMVSGIVVSHGFWWSSSQVAFSQGPGGGKLTCARLVGDVFPRSCFMQDVSAPWTSDDDVDPVTPQSRTDPLGLPHSWF